MAGKPKFHLCLCIGETDGIYKFLMINSAAGYKSDVIFADGEIPGLPKSKGGISVISLSTISRVKAEKMKLWKPTRVDAMPALVINRLISEIPGMDSLTGPEKRQLLEFLEKTL